MYYGELENSQYLLSEHRPNPLFQALDLLSPPPLITSEYPLPEHRPKGSRILPPSTRTSVKIPF